MSQSIYVCSLTATFPFTIHNVKFIGSTFFLSWYRIYVNSLFITENVLSAVDVVIGTVAKVKK